MNTTRILYHLLRADFLQRVRNYGFLGLLHFSVFLTYLFIPETSDIQIAQDYNSAGITPPATPPGSAR